MAPKSCRPGPNSRPGPTGRHLSTRLRHPPNFVKAHAWYNLAATHGNQAGAAGLRDNLEAQMTADQIAQAQALAAELHQRIKAAKTR